MTSQTLPPMKNAHLEGSDKNIPKERESKHEKKENKRDKRNNLQNISQHSFEWLWFNEA